jgi:DNA-directed RNA polymerase subunit RPC12/RpoP
MAQRTARTSKASKISSSRFDLSPTEWLMTDQPKPPRKAEVYEVTCWHCHRTAEIDTSKRPYRCPHRGALLLIKWRSIR